MLNTKRKIIKSFNKKACTYNTAATIQAYVAAQLASKLTPHSPNTILEIGCGTGLLSQHFIKLFPDASLLITDAATAMIAQCQRLMPPHSHIDFVCMDGETLAVNNHYDLIVSSMTLHWFSDLQKSFIDITNQLKRDGQFIFSILGENSFKEWREMCQQFNIPTATPLFPAEHLLQTMLPNVKLEVSLYQKTYENAYAFLSSLKKIGATTSRIRYTPLSPTKLRQVLRYFNKEITISYEIIYATYHST